MAGLDHDRLKASTANEVDLVGPAFVAFFPLKDSLTEHEASECTKDGDEQGSTRHTPTHIIAVPQVVEEVAFLHGKVLFVDFPHDFAKQLSHAHFNFLQGKFLTDFTEVEEGGCAEQAIHTGHNQCRCVTNFVRKRFLHSFRTLTNGVVNLCTNSVCIQVIQRKFAGNLVFSNLTHNVSFPFGQYFVIVIVDC